MIVLGYEGGPGGSVGIATDYVLDGPGIESLGFRPFVCYKSENVY
jgi:hypothetical protein